MKHLFTLICMLIVSACSGEENGKAGVPPSPSSVQIAYAESSSPDDPALAAIYDRSCRACHSVPDSGAPLTGHAAAWNARLQTKGMGGLVQSTRQGIGTMPPMGMCPDCGDEEFTALIRFMAKEAM